METKNKKLPVMVDLEKELVRMDAGLLRIQNSLWVARTQLTRLTDRLDQLTNDSERFFELRKPSDSRNKD